MTTGPSEDPEHVRHVYNILCECDKGYISEVGRFFGAVSKNNLKHGLTKKTEKHLRDGHCVY